MSGILVVAEHREGELRDATLEALGAALELGGQGGDVTVAVLAADAETIASRLVGRAPALRLVSHPELREYDPELYLPPLEELLRAGSPRLVLMGHTSQGMDLAPALAGRLGLPLVTDCVGLAWQGGRLVAERRPYGGKIEERLELRPAETTLVTLQAGAFAAAEPTGVRTSRETLAPAELRPRHLRRFVERLRAAAGDVDIGAAELLVSVGRGIGSQENIALAQTLADLCGGVVSCSRPVADAGWLPQSRQVGTSGRTVRPRLYVALGISGAFQHLAGMKGSDTILAVNKDPRAPIFQVAHFGIVDDVMKVLPALAEQLRK